MPASKVKQAEVDERRTALIKLRRANPKLPFFDPQVLALGYTSDSAARKDFYRALEDRRKDLATEVTAYREEQNEVLEALLTRYLPLALDDEQPDHKSAEMVLKLLERQAKLNGWESALKAELSGPGGGPMQVGPTSLAELRAAIVANGDPDDEDEDNEDTDLDDAEDNEDEDDDGDDG